MRPDRFPIVNDVMLAEALRQLLPVALHGFSTGEINESLPVLERAKLTLEMWTRQEKGRLKKLGGPLPVSPYPELQAIRSADYKDPGQTIPAECERVRKPKKGTTAKKRV